jgi:twitching motility protein PilT
MRIKDLLRQMCDDGASDLLISVGVPPYFRVKGQLQAGSATVLTAQDTQKLAHELLSPPQLEAFEHDRSIDFAATMPDGSRYRVNIFHQMASVSLAIRLIPSHIPQFEELGLPPIVGEFANSPHGLVLVTGPACNGKSTTLAAMIDYINTQRASHIVCIEDPIEYVHTARKSVIEQIEVLSDTPSFEAAMRSVFRQNPDIVMVGEMRDLETIRLALTLAETGHLILATLHTHDTTNALNRIVSVFPTHEQQQIYTQLSMSLVGIIAQQLLTVPDGSSLVLAYEVMRINTAIANLIREQHLQQIYSSIQTGRRSGMCTMNDSLQRLCDKGQLDPERAIARSPRPKELMQMLHGTPGKPSRKLGRSGK